MLLIGAVVALLSVGLKDNSIIWEQLSTQNEGRKTVQDLTNEVRSATYSNVGAYPIATATPSELVFYTDLDGDSLRERVRYFLSGTLFKKGVTKPTGNPLAYNPVNEVLQDEVHDIANTSTPIFTYFDENYAGSGSPLTQPVTVAQIRMVKIYLILEENPAASPAPLNITAQTEVRNLKTN